MGMTTALIGVGCALIGGASGAVATHIVQKRMKEKEYQNIINYKRAFNYNYNNRGVRARYNRVSGY